LTPAVRGQIVLTGGELDLTHDVTIRGLPDQPATISGGGASRIFTVEPGADVVLEDLVLTAGAADQGGAIFNNGTLTVSGSTLSGNSAGYGGGIYNASGTLTVSDSTLSGNSASVFGGGIYNVFATLTVSDSTLSGNSAQYGGGGIVNSRFGTVTVSGSTLYANSAL